MSADQLFDQSFVAERFSARVADLAAKMGVTSGDMCLALEGLIAATIVASSSPSQIEENVAVAQHNLKTLAAKMRAATLAEADPQGAA